jgi:hypothetical protein
VIRGRDVRSADPSAAVGARNTSPYAHDARSFVGASIHLPPDSQGRVQETVIRPALAVLFRIGIGPSADRYVRRFLAFERAGRGWPGWHWPSLFLPCVWAFYRRLWLPGLLFALLPIAGAFAFTAIAPRFERADAMWVACAVLSVWILPGVLPALCADALLYLRVRRLVRRAEDSAKGPSDAVKRLSALEPTSTVAALCLGGGALILALGTLLPYLHAAYADLDVRNRLAQTLGAARVLERDIEASWTSARLVPWQTAHPAFHTQADGALIDEVHVSPITGRVKLAFGASVPQLSGKSILLAPSRDAQNHVQWLCVPIDIPQRYLPKECRG